MKLKTFFYYLLQVTWGLVNNIIAFEILIVLMIINPRRNRKMFFNAFLIEWKLKSSLGIGNFIFTDNSSKDICIHEYGHNIQSVILGPLFLFVIGIPSFLWLMLPVFKTKRKIKKMSYYDFYPERWANKLGIKYTKNNP